MTMIDHRPTASAAAGPATTAEKPPVRLFLRLPEGATVRQRRPSWLARGFRLELYPDSPLLTTRARREMNLAALLLLVVSGFELAIWTTLFHDLFGVRVAAVLAGCAFATVVCYFERQLIVHDEVAHGRAGKAMLVRVGYIAIGALITSQALELRIFGEPIRTRVHAEEVRREALTRLSTLAVAEGNLKALTTAAQHDTEEAVKGQEAAGDAGTGHAAGNEPPAAPLNPLAFKVQTSQERAELQQREKAVQTAAKNLAAKQGQLLGAEGQLRSIRDGLRALQARPDLDPDGEQQRHLEAQRRSWQARRAQLAEESSAAAIQLDDSRKQRGGAAEKLDEKRQAQQDELDDVKGKVDALHQRLVDWVGRLQRAKPGEPVTEPGGDWAFGEQPYDFLQRLRVLGDLLDGRRARWEGGTPDDVDRLRHEFNLYEPQRCDERAASASEPCDPEESDRIAAERWKFWLAWIVGLGLAIYIPLLVITLKWFLFPEELRLYYSRLHQQVAGQMEAVLTASVNSRARGLAAAGKVGAGGHS
jgi:hypothetical protein